MHKMYLQSASIGGLYCFFINDILNYFFKDIKKLLAHQAVLTRNFNSFFYSTKDCPSFLHFSASLLAPKSQLLTVPKSPDDFFC